MHSRLHPSEQLEWFSAVFTLMPRENRYVLESIINLLSLISMRSHGHCGNKMSARNLAVVMAPNLVRIDKKRKNWLGKNASETESQFESNERAIALVELMICWGCVMFSTPVAAINLSIPSESEMYVHFKQQETSDQIDSPKQLVIKTTSDEDKRVIEETSTTTNTDADAIDIIAEQTISVECYELTRLAHQTAISHYITLTSSSHCADPLNSGSISVILGLDNEGSVLIKHESDQGQSTTAPVNALMIEDASSTQRHGAANNIMTNLKPTVYTHIDDEDFEQLPLIKHNLEYNNHTKKWEKMDKVAPVFTSTDSMEEYEATMRRLECEAFGQRRSRVPGIFGEIADEVLAFTGDSLYPRPI